MFPTTGLLTSKAGDATSFTVVLATQPAANVTLNLHSSNTSEAYRLAEYPDVHDGQLECGRRPSRLRALTTIRRGAFRIQVVFAPAVSTDPNYSGLTPSAVSVTNLPNEVKNIQVTSLAVNPSTGLEPRVESDGHLE